MAEPNQGPPPGAPGAPGTPGAPGPPPGTNANTDPDPNPGHTFPVRDIDLSDPMFVSDGAMQQHQATVDVEFLGRLSICFNRESNFITTLGTPPVLFWPIGIPHLLTSSYRLHYHFHRWPPSGIRSGDSSLRQKDRWKRGSGLLRPRTS